MNGKIPKLWPDSTVWVLGSGPSLELLKGRGDEMRHHNVVAVHYSFLIGDWVDVLFMGDARCYWELKDKIDKFQGPKFSLNIHLNGNKRRTLVGESKNITILQFERKFGICKARNKLYYNGSAGGAAINLAYHLGAKKIILIGFDMKLKNGQLHYQDLKNPHTKTDIMKSKWFNKKIWERIERHAKSLKVEIVNASPDNKMPSIKSVALDGVI